MATSLTYSTVARIVAGNSRIRIVDVTADGTYSASGYTLAAADYTALFGAPGTQTTTQSLSYAVKFDSETNLGGVTATLDRTNSKMLFWEAGAQATTTISSKVVRVSVTHGLSNYK